MRRIALQVASPVRFAASLVAAAALVLPVACAGELSGGIGGGSCADGCNQPPPAVCSDGTTLQTFAARGTCNGGRCSYPSQTRTCTTSCTNGACVGEDPCIGVVCNAPPASTCADANTLTAYDVGTCQNGTCNYPSKAITCNEGCANDQCTNQPCAGVVCASPPASTCKDANTLTSYGATGTCAAGQCSYTSSDTPCASGCANGQCTGDPCAGVTCNSPPGPSCSGNNVRTYQSSGTCSAGQCNYAFSDTSCSSGCANGACISASGTLYVDASAGSGGNGSMQSPFDTITAAVSAASANTLIKVAAGSYGAVTINKTLTLQGGFAGGGSWTNRDPKANVTTITGGSAAVVRLNNAGATVIDGFHITGGNGVSESGARHGGGVYISGGSPTISNCVIENNGSFGSQDSRGGGVYTRQADTKILDNTIRNNKSGRGGAIAVEGGNVEIRRNLIENNEGNSDHGGGLELTGKLTVTDNIVRGNAIGRSLGYGWGGGIDIFNQGTTATLQRNIVTNNSAPTIGSGEFVDDGATATIENELIYANKCCETGGAGLYVDGDGGIGSNVTIRFSTIAAHNCGSGTTGNAIFIEQSSSVTVENCIFWGNGDDYAKDGSSSITVRYTNSQESISGTGNISTNPQFVNASGGDFHLKSTKGHWNGTGWSNDGSNSPSIDTASPSAPFTQEPSPNGSRANMGRYGDTKEASKTP